MVSLILSVLLAANTPTFLYQDPATDQAIRRTMQATYNLDLATARKEAQALQAKYPDHPVGYTLMAETYWWEAQTDPGNKTIEDAYYRANEVAVDKAEKALNLKKYPEIEVTAYLASAHGSYARFQVTQKGAFFSAMRAGLRAHGYAERVYQKDPMYYDIWIGIGAFNYFTGSLPSVIKPFAWLIGARGDARLGLEQLRTAIDRARYGQTEARIVYYTALLEDKQYEAAFRVLEKLISDYPNNFALYVWATDWFLRQEKHAEGAVYFEKLHQNQGSRRTAPYALLEKAQLQAAGDRNAEARQTIARICSIAGGDAVLLRRAQALERKL